MGKQRCKGDKDKYIKLASIFFSEKSNGMMCGTYKNSVVGLITFRLQLHHVFDENFGVPAQQCFDALCSQHDDYGRTQFNWAEKRGEIIKIAAALYN